MDHDNLSPDVRHRLWQCYSLLLSLAEEAEQEPVVEVDTDTGQGSAIDKTNIAFHSDVEPQVTAKRQSRRSKSLKNNHRRGIDE